MRFPASLLKPSTCSLSLTSALCWCPDPSNSRAPNCPSLSPSSQGKQTGSPNHSDSPERVPCPQRKQALPWLCRAFPAWWCQNPLLEGLWTFILQIKKPTSPHPPNSHLPCPQKPALPRRVLLPASRMRNGLLLSKLHFCGVSYTSEVCFKWTSRIALKGKIWTQIYADWHQAACEKRGEKSPALPARQLGPPPSGKLTVCKWIPSSFFRPIAVAALLNLSNIC